MNDHKSNRLAFLAGAGWGGAEVSPLAGDASTRAYFRVALDGNTAILMDAPGGQERIIDAFLSISAFLRTEGFSAPEIFAVDQTRGFVLMEDLGDVLFAGVLVQDSAEELPLYEAAVDVLIALEKSTPPDGMNLFTPQEMVEQASLVFETYCAFAGRGCEAGKKAEVLRQLETVLTGYSGGRSTLLLRDYHAENLIWLPQRKGHARVGLLDFQDAMIGPPGYDLISLLLDARRDVSTDVADAMVTRFAEGTGRNIDTLRAGLAAIGVQRNLRILGVFARLALQSGKPSYVDLIPRVWGHVQSCLRHPALSDLASALDGLLPEPDAAVLDRLRRP